MWSNGSRSVYYYVGLSRDVTAASSWADIWGMLFNAEKSEHIMICGRGLKRVAPQPSVSMAGIPIPQVKIHKHLGVIFNDTVTWSNHIDKVYERCAQGVGILRRLRRTFPSRALRRIYVGAVLPIMEYACPVWGGGPVAKLIHLHGSLCRRNQTSLPPLQWRIQDLSHGGGGGGAWNSKTTKLVIATRSRRGPALAPSRGSGGMLPGKF